LNACSALDLLTTEHPKVMTTLSAILITVGSIPAIPVIASGAGGAILASGAAHAVGAVAVGVGSWIKLQQESKQKTLAATEASESGKSK
jgi:flagellar biosynthesis component FlhA